ncbi:MAG: hypothetical protein ACSHYB_07895 [Roseibacillus sp.]
MKPDTPPVVPQVVPPAPDRVPTDAEIENTKTLQKENKARELSQTIGSMRSKTLHLARELGELLADLKESKPHGTWEDYTGEELKIHPRSASTYIRIWEETKNYPSLEAYAKSEDLSDLTIGGIQAHLAKKDAKKKENGLKQIQQGRSQSRESASSPLILADGSKTDARKLSLEDALVDVETISNHFSPDNPAKDSTRDPKLQAQVQRVTASLLAALSKSIGSRRDQEAYEVADMAIAELQTLLKNKDLPTPGPQT